MKFIGYFDITGMTPHQAISHLTEAQQENYKAQIYSWLSSNHFIVDPDGDGIELAVVTDQVLVPGQGFTSDPTSKYAIPQRTQTEPVMVTRHRLQYAVHLEALPVPPASGLILPGQQNGQMTQIVLQPASEEADTP